MLRDDHSRGERATLSDVAKLAGVSVATASKALNGRTHVNPRTRRQVIQAAEKLAFQPNNIAPHFSRKRSGLIGLIAHDFDGRLSLPILRGAEDALGPETTVLLCDARGDTLRERYHVQTLLGRSVDGLIVVGPNGDPRPSLGGLMVPVVYALAPSEDRRDMSQTAAEIQAGALAAEHLLKLGRRRIIVLSGGTDSATVREHAAGATDALRRGGIEPINREFFGGHNEAWARTEITHLLRTGPLFDGVVCGSDQIARGVLDALQNENVRVPQDVAVVGHGNWEALVMHARPALTSIDMNLAKLGQRAARRLMGAISGRPSPGIENVEPEVVIRQSAPLPPRRGRQREISAHTRQVCARGTVSGLSGVGV